MPGGFVDVGTGWRTRMRRQVGAVAPEGGGANDIDVCLLPLLSAVVTEGLGRLFCLKSISWHTCATKILLDFDYALITPNPPL